MDGGHDGVLAMLLGTGINSATAANLSLQSSYTDIEVAILVGICGDVPRIDNFDAYLGDVVVGKNRLI